MDVQFRQISWYLYKDIKVEASSGANGLFSTTLSVGLMSSIDLSF
jgi:hypothetical protein